MTGNTLIADSIEQPLSVKLIPKEQALHNRLLFWFTFLTAFPCLLLFYNLSFFLFPFLLFAFKQQFGYFFRLRNTFQWFAIFFGISSVISTLASNNIVYSLDFLPFYLYWPVLLLFMVSHRENFEYEIIAKALCIGLILTTFYYFFIQHTGILAVPFFRKLSQNNFAFISNCFAPVAVYYIKTKRGHRAGLMLAIGLTVAAFLGGSRSGSLLVFMGTFLTMYASKITSRQIFALAPVLVIFAVLEYTGVLRKMVHELNYEVYDLVYRREETLFNDQSYLLRLALVEKGVILFKKHPFAGIGLNNFTHTKQEIEGNFKNASHVMYKKDFYEKGSPHNSYLLLLSEGGLLLIIPFLALQLYGVVVVVQNFRELHPFYLAVFFGFIAMSMHMYVIAAIANYFGWFLLGLVGCIVPMKKQKRGYVRLEAG